MRICQNCGAEISDTAKFCRKCGSKVETIEAAEAFEAEAPATATETFQAEAPAETAAEEFEAEAYDAASEAETFPAEAFEAEAPADETFAENSFAEDAFAEDAFTEDEVTEYEFTEDEFAAATMPQEEMPQVEIPQAEAPQAEAPQEQAGAGQPLGVGAGTAEFIGKDYQWGPPTGGENYSEQAMPAVFVKDTPRKEEREEKQDYTYRIEAPSYDHTDEFDPEDISDNKVTAMAAYVLGPLGVIIALLAGQNSPYAEFHMRQGLKFVVVEALIAIITMLLCWTLIVPVAAVIVMVILFVVKIITFFSVCRGKAVEPAIIRSLKFLK